MKFPGLELNRLASGAGRIFGFLKFFLFAKKMFKKLPNVDIAVFDTYTAPDLCKALADYSFFTVDARGESLHLIILFKSALKYLRLRGKKKLSILYWSMFVKDLGAKICITHQDANAFFFDIARENKDVKFIALQQGLKNSSTIANYKNICGDYYVFGSAYADKLDNGEAKFYIAGSLKANIAEFERGKYSRLCYISSYVDCPPGLIVLGNYNFAEFFYPSTYSSLRLVEDFCVKSKIDLVITSKSFRQKTENDREDLLQNEMKFYKNILGKEVDIISGDSYKSAGESRLVVSAVSALGYELLGRGCKVVFLSFASHFVHNPSYGFGWPLELPDQGPFWSNIPDPVYVEKMLNNIWYMSQDEWDEITKIYKEKLMFHDQGNTILHGQIKAVLGGGENRRTNVAVDCQR
jgi:surface carbohydrate biosynthesis protein